MTDGQTAQIYKRCSLLAVKSRESEYSKCYFFTTETEKINALNTNFGQVCLKKIYGSKMA